MMQGATVISRRAEGLIMAGNRAIREKDLRKKMGAIYFPQVVPCHSL